MKVRNRFIFLIPSISLILQINAAAQTNIKGVVNIYTSASAVDTCDNKLTVGSPTGFIAGMKVVILQNTGAVMAQNDDSNFGSLIDIKSVGAYEINQIDSVSGSTIFLKYKLKNAYIFDKATVQLISFPSYGSVTVVDTLKATPWNGSTGGVLAFEANTLTLNAPVTASALGFRGGGVPNPYTNCTGGPFSSSGGFVYPLSSQDGGQKGEGVAPTLTGGESGRGRQTNGGGGGNNHNSGGGGGGNIGGGGQGGENDESRYFGCHGKNPGLGGFGLPVFANRAYMGGGGGAGHDNNQVATKGGNGGGLILIRTVALNGNSQRIVANGENTLRSTGDGAGAGGGGGTIAVEAGQVNGNILLEAMGGKGGDAGEPTSGKDRCQGPGGGGGGGGIFVNSSSGLISKNISGGKSGKYLVPGSPCDGSSNNAADGQPGLTTITKDTVLPTAKSLIVRVLSIVQQPASFSICSGKTATFTLGATGTGLTYQWQVNTGAGFQDISDGGRYNGSKTNTLVIANTDTTLNRNMYRAKAKGGCGSLGSLTSNPASVTVHARASAIFTYTVASNTVAFTNLGTFATGYIWNFGDNSAPTAVQSPTHTFATQGVYMVTLLAFNECDTIKYVQNISLNTSPAAGFTANISNLCIPATVRFNSTASNNTTGWKWSFPGGVPSASSDTNPKILYDSAGVYDVTLRVTNANGTDTLLRSSYIRVGGPPAVSFTKSLVGQAATFTNSSIGANGYVWDFGDGSTSTEVNPQHTYPAKGGDFVVSLTATNPCGSAAFTDTLHLINLPTAVVNANQTTGCVPLVVQFSGRNSSFVSGWSWKFPGGSPSTSNQQNPIVTYNTAGNYDVVLKVNNAAGSHTTTQSQYIQLQPTPDANFTTTIQGNTVYFRNLSTPLQNYKWDFDDGSFSDEFNPPAHYYPHNKVYNINLLVVNGYCGVDVAQPAAIFTTGIADVDSSQLISVYPNPTTGDLFIRANAGVSPADAYKMYISDADGRVLKEIDAPTAAGRLISVNELVSGVYFLRYISDKGTVLKKIVKL